MAAEASLPLTEVYGYTFRELYRYWQHVVLKDWDHTALLGSYLHNLHVCVLSIGGVKEKGKTPSDVHPYREEKPQGITVAADNIGVLRLAAKAITR